MNNKNPLNKTINKQQNAIETTETESTEVYYGNLIMNYKVLIDSLKSEIAEYQRKESVIDRAMDLKNKEFRKILAEKDHEIKILEDELLYHRKKEDRKTMNKPNARKLVQELHEIKTRKREQALSGVELDREAVEFLKKYAL